MQLARDGVPATIRREQMYMKRFNMRPVDMQLIKEVRGVSGGRAAKSGSNDVDVA